MRQQILMRAGMVRNHPQGVSVFYEISELLIFDLCEVVCDRISTRLLAQAHQLEQLNIPAR